ncbi:MAG: hypothetical protein JWN14_3988 [Chthonomonadales bacterium]|nr:hypothetical protein [Chthonomonadales bacterium]
MPNSMSDAILVRIIEEMTKPLSDLNGHCSADEMVPSYNALLGAAQANHPDVPFLNAMEPIPQKSINSGPLLALFAQLRIVLEYLQER